MRARRIDVPGIKNTRSLKKFFWQERKSMTDWMNVTMLICAAIGAMAFGILLAYGILRTGFALMQPRKQTAAVKTGAEAARVL
jgi:hypothetical protein